MRTIVIPYDAMLKATSPLGSLEYEGVNLILPVHVGWPELRLTEHQQWANILALAAGQERPYPDHSYFNVQIPRMPFSIRA